MVNLEQNLQQQIVAKALKDEVFQQQLLANPKAAIQTLGVEVSESIELQVLQETPNQIYLVLPQKASLKVENQLSDEELEAVAGGKTCINTGNYDTSNWCLQI